MFRSWCAGIVFPRFFHDSGEFPDLSHAFRPRMRVHPGEPFKQASCRILHTCRGGAFGWPIACPTRDGNENYHPGTKPGYDIVIGAKRRTWRSLRTVAQREKPSGAPGVAAPARGMGSAAAGLTPGGGNEKAPWGAPMGRRRVGVAGNRTDTDARKGATAARGLGGWDGPAPRAKERPCTRSPGRRRSFSPWPCRWGACRSPSRRGLGR